MPDLVLLALVYLAIGVFVWVFVSGPDRAARDYASRVSQGQGQTPSLGMIIVATAVMILIWPRFAVGIIKGLRS